MRLRILFVAFIFSLPVLPVTAQTAGMTRLLRQPDINGDRIAFVYAGDIWTVESRGGVARRLTSHPGQELFPKFSRDGKWIAFSAEYSGNRQVYVVSADGGEPRQLTYYNDVGPMPPRGGWDYEVLDWTPDGKNVVVRANRLPWSERMGRPYLVPVNGGMETPLPIPESGGGMLSPDGTKMVYTPIEREFRTWKRYRGGRAQDVWIYDLAKNTAEQITNNPATDNQPMWIGNTIYFTSDRGPKSLLNLWAYDLGSKQTRQVTFHDEYDVLWPATGGGQIVYENGGYVYRFDPVTGKSQVVPIAVHGDFPGTLPYFSNVRENIDSWGVSPSGARALLSARGDLFTAPAKEGEIRNITRSEGVREIDPVWSPDGQWIAYLSDRSGEYEIYVRRQDGSGEERRVTTDGDIWRFQPLWSPDGRMLAFGDRKQRLRIVEVATGRMIDADHSDQNDITHYRWSPDNAWIAYSRVAPNRLTRIYLYNVKQAKSYALTSGQTNDYEPVFDPKGRYIYFLSDRDYNLTFSGFEFSYVYTDPTRVYVGVLSENGPALFLPSSDEEKGSAGKEDAVPNTAAKKKPDQTSDATDPTPEEKPAAAAAGKTPPASVPTIIDIAGFERRVRAIPGSPADYRTLSANGSGVFYLVGSGHDAKLKFYNLEDKKESMILEGIDDYQLSANGEKVMFRKGSEYGIAAAKEGQKSSDGPLNLARLEMKIDPRKEWQEEFVDAWRNLRDWFYDPNMHGVDWKQIREKYGAIVPFVSTRSDLDYLFGEMAGELNSSHTYVSPADETKSTRIEGGLLGAEIESDPSGTFRIRHIFPGENWDDQFRSPLTEPGIHVREGDLILAVDGRSSKEVTNFYELLEGKADRVVTLLIGPGPDRAAAHEERVRPVAHEGNLRYLDWVRSRREYVEKASGGRIGYLHLPNTATEGNRELFKYFYPQANKEALIIDDRYNGGGFIPDRMIELLDRPRLNYWARRGVAPDPTPGYSHEGPKVMLINGYSSSGGDALPYYFRKRGLGKLIGTRTWGGLIGISYTPSLADGGSISAPSFRFLDTEGHWAVEGIGVVPDIEVVDRPDLVAAGHDPSLEKAVEVLMQELKDHPPVQVVAPPPPVEPK
jgi:tricorn protease